MYHVTSAPLSLLQFHPHKMWSKLSCWVESFFKCNMLRPMKRQRELNEQKDLNLRSLINEW